MKRLKGDCEIINGKEEFPWFAEPSWDEIPEDLKSVVAAGILKTDYKCPQCNGIHRYDTLICPQGDIILKGIPLNTCILFNNDGYFLCLRERYAYSLRNNQRVVTKEGNIYDWETDRWVFLHKIKAYEEIDNGVWALFHRI